MSASSTPSFSAVAERERADSDLLVADLIAQGKDKHLTDGYAKYVAGVRETQARHGIDPTQYHPFPFTSFKHEQCVLCAETITDDPYGHNPAPFRDDCPSGHCCGSCNSRLVVPTRVRFMTAKGKSEKTKLTKVIKGIDDHSKFMCESRNAPDEKIMSRFSFGVSNEEADKMKWEKVVTIAVDDAPAVLDGYFENHLFQWFHQYATEHVGDEDIRAKRCDDLDWELFQFLSKRNSNRDDATGGWGLCRFFHRNRPLWSRYMKRFAEFFMNADDDYWTHAKMACEKRRADLVSLGIAPADINMQANKKDEEMASVCRALREMKVLDAPAHSVYLAVNSKNSHFVFTLYIPKSDVPPLCAGGHACGDKCDH